MNLLTHCPRLLLAALLIGTAGLIAADDEKPADEKEVNKLIDQLGDEDPDVRQGAREKLFKVGEPALEHIRKAIKSHPDPDVRLRAILLARDINVGAFGQLRKFEGHTGHVRTLVVLKDGKRMLSGSMDGTVRLWDLDSGKELKKFDIPGGWGWQIALDPVKNEFVVSGGKNETVHRFDIDSGKELKSYKLPANHWAYGVAVSKDGKHVFGGVSGKDSDFSIRRFDAVTGKEDAKLLGHTGFVWRLRISPDGKKLASVGCNDSSFRLWDADSGKELFNGKEAHDGYFVGVDFGPAVRWFDEGNTLRLADTASSEECVALLEAVPEFIDTVLIPFDFGRADSAQLVAACEFALEGLYAQNKISRNEEGGYTAATRAKKDRRGMIYDDLTETGRYS